MTENSQKIETENSQKIDILSLYVEELSEEMAKLKEKPFRAKQIFSWLHQKRVGEFSAMTDISEMLRKKLDEKFYISQITPIRRQQATDGTVKFLFKLWDENTIETVMMHHSYGNSVCVSTQVGCRMGCKFCASTVGGKVRDLTASEILLQVYTIGKLLDKKVDKVVLMGIGEPLDNYNNVMRFLKLINHKNGLNMSHRHISLSTCGVVPNIYRLSEENLQLTLSISLHAADNETRSSVMPINNVYKIEELMKACKYYFNKTHRRISYEYALIAGVNDSISQAQKLSQLLKGQGCHINLIPVNPVKGTGFSKTDKIKAQAFLNKLESNGFTATFRKEMGSEIDAACGQLRQKDREGERPNVVER